MAYIKTISEDEAEGRLKRIYETAIRRAGSVAEVIRIQSLTPQVLDASIRLYQAMMLDRSSLSRAQREMIAVVVSKTNDCFY